MATEAVKIRCLIHEMQREHKAKAPAYLPIDRGSHVGLPAVEKGMFKRRKALF